MESQSLWFESALLPGGWQRGVRLGFARGRIALVEHDVAPAVDDARHAIGVPGLPNLHSHAFQRGLAGLTERRGAGADSFWTWRERMYGFLDRMGPEELEALTALAYAEMLESGFTRVAEFHYVHHAPDGRDYGDPAEMGTRVMSAAGQAGIGLTLLPVFYAQGGFGGQPPGAQQRRFIHAPASYERLLEATRAAAHGGSAGPGSPATVVGRAVHSLRAVTPEALVSVVPAREPGPVHIHIAEQQREVDDCIAWSGARPIEWLLDHAGVDERWCLVHATHASAGELERIAASRAVVGLCPVTEANLGDGIFPADEFMERGGCWGVGSDSNVLIDAAGELCLLEYTQRLARRARNVLAGAPERSTGRALFEAALEGGRALWPAQGAPPGGLQVGAAGDVVSLDPAHPALVEHHGDELLDAWIFAAGRCAVDRVWVDGIERVAGGRHHARDALRAGHARALARLRGLS